MQEISYKDLKFNPFNLIGGEWMLITAGARLHGTRLQVVLSV
jgi:hypothetical protein